MKKYIIIAVALVASVACSKVQTVEPQKEINFEVANSLQTKASGSLYNNGAFGTYAWFTANPGAGSDHAPFMVNETVDLVGGVWKTSLHTFYWPKTGSVEFISYSPFNGTNATADSNPALTQNTITYTSLTAGDVDYMYADKATASKNVNMVTDGVDSGYSGVPTIFRHALAKLSFKIKANFVKYEDPTTHAITTWDVTVKSAKISGCPGKSPQEKFGQTFPAQPMSRSLSMLPHTLPESSFLIPLILTTPQLTLRLLHLHM